MPHFLVSGAKRRLGALAGRKVGVLGLAFKADTDDERDSLAHKLVRLLERELARCHFAASSDSTAPAQTRHERGPAS